MSHESTFLSCTLKFLEKHIGTTASGKIILVSDILLYVSSPTEKSEGTCSR